MRTTLGGRAKVWVRWLALGWLLAAALGRAQDGAGLGAGVVLEREVRPTGDDRFARVVFTAWLPEPGRPVRAVILHQHGCGNASAATHPPIAQDFHWQALARKHDAALLVPHYTVEGDCANWNDPDSGSERALLATLRDFAQRSGRPELEAAPWLLWGHSGGSSWAVQMILRHPGRVLAASLRGGCHKQFGDPAFREKFVAGAREIPLLFVWGLRESTLPSRHFVSWEPMQAMYRQLRLAGARVALAIDPRNEHDCGDARLLALAHFDAVLAARRAGESLAGAWVDGASREIVRDPAQRRADPAQGWLPSPAVAAAWREFSERGTLSPAHAPRAKPELQVAWDAEKRRAQLQWWLEPELDGGVRVVRIYRDRVLWREIGRADAAFLATSRDSPPHGLHQSTIVDEAVSPGAEPVYAVSFVDAAGAESPLSAPAALRR